MRFPLVMKFGGAGLEDGPAVESACGIIEEHAAEDPIVVVSAHAGVTQDLEECAREAARGRFALEGLRLRHKGLLRQLGLDSELLDRLLTDLGQVLFSLSERRSIEPEELDFVLSFGERMSARVVAASLRQRGVTATPVDAFDLGLTTDSCHGSARPLPGVEASLRRSLDDIPGVPIVTGFLAKDDSGKLTTLGRNGSDLTAALVARAAGARRLVFWKSVPGILTADPALVPDAKVIDSLAFREAQALAFHGAEILHHSALEPVRAGEFLVEVRDVRDPYRPGTRLEDRDPSSRPVALAGSAELDGLLVHTAGAGALSALSALLHAHNVRPRLLQIGPEGVAVYAAPSTGMEILARELSGRATDLQALSSVVIVGGGGETLRRALEVLAEKQLEPVRLQAADSSVGQVLLFERASYLSALRILHAGLLLRTPA